MEPVEFGKYLKTLRESRNVSIRKLSIMSGISISYISQLENGKRGIPKPSILKKLAPCFNISYESLMTAAGYIYNESVNEEQKASIGNSGANNDTVRDKDIAEKLRETIDYIENQKGLLLDGEPLDELGRAVLKQSIEFGLSYVRGDAKRNKQKQNL